MPAYKYNPNKGVRYRICSDGSVDVWYEPPESPPDPEEEHRYDDDGVYEEEHRYDDDGVEEYERLEALGLLDSDEDEEPEKPSMWEKYWPKPDPLFSPDEKQTIADCIDKFMGV